MKAKLVQGDVEAFEVSPEILPEILGMIIPDPAVTSWSVNGSGLSLSLRVWHGDAPVLQAYTGNWLVRINGRFWTVLDDLFHQIIELQPELELPQLVWVPRGELMVQTALSNLPGTVGKNQVTGAYIEAQEKPYGVKGFPLSFYPVKDAAVEARLIAPRLAQFLGWDNLLGMTRLVSGPSELEPGKLARFWFTVCNGYGQAIKEDK